MKTLTAQKVLDFATEHSGTEFFTIARKKRFVLEVDPDRRIVFRPDGSKQPFYLELATYVDHYNLHKPSKPSGYPKRLWTNSYWVSLVRALLAENSSTTPLESNLPSEIIEIISAGPTEREELLKSRIGQGAFRQSLIELRGRCYVTGIADERFLRASHIKPWCDSTNTERLDAHNGLLLSPVYDHLFDRALITFDSQNRILISPKIPAQIVEAFGLDAAFIGSDLGEKTEAYLKMHRQRFDALAEA